MNQQEDHLYQLQYFIVLVCMDSRYFLCVIINHRFCTFYVIPQLEVAHTVCSVNSETCSAEVLHVTSALNKTTSVLKEEA